MNDMTFNWILRVEGGYVNHPKDPGGETNMGITAGTLAAARKVGLINCRSVKDLSREDVRTIYDARYYLPCMADKITDPGLALIHFDTAVNSGVGGAARLLRRAVNRVSTGRQVANSTQMCVDLCQVANALPAKALSCAYLDERLAFYRRLKTFQIFGRGWTNRLKNLATHIGLQWKPI